MPAMPGETMGLWGWSGFDPNSWLFLSQKVQCVPQPLAGADVEGGVAPPEEGRDGRDVREGGPRRQAGGGGGGSGWWWWRWWSGGGEVVVVEGCWLGGGWRKEIISLL